MDDNKSLVEQEEELSGLYQEALETTVESLENVDPTDVLDGEYKSGLTYDFRQGVADEVDCSTDTVTRAVDRNPLLLLWKASEAGLSQATLEELRSELPIDLDVEDRLHQFRDIEEQASEMGEVDAQWFGDDDEERDLSVETPVQNDQWEEVSDDGGQEYDDAVTMAAVKVLVVFVVVGYLAQRVLRSRRS